MKNELYWNKADAYKSQSPNTSNNKAGGKGKREIIQEQTRKLCTSQENTNRQDRKRSAAEVWDTEDTGLTCGNRQTDKD